MLCYKCTNKKIELMSHWGHWVLNNEPGNVTMLVLGELEKPYSNRKQTYCVVVNSASAARSALKFTFA